MNVKNLVKDLLLKVLIVDDELDICFLLSGILRQKSFQTAYVTTLTDAEIALNKDRPSILFLDNHLPDGKGLDFVSTIKNKYPGVKIVMITAHDGPLERSRALAEGVDTFIPKPFSSDIIFSAIDNLRKA